jgi:predicted transcriptional regulator
MSHTVRVEHELHARLRELASRENLTISQIIGKSVDYYERHLFWQGVREDFARLQSDPVAWQEYEDELKAWDALTADGLEIVHDERSGTY